MGEAKLHKLSEIEVRFLRRYRDPKAAEEFYKSLDAEGQLVPVILALVNGRLILADGHCRFEGLKALGRTEVLGTVDPRLDTEEKLLAFLVKTETRTGRNPVDFGLHLKAYREKHGLTNRQVAEALKLSEHAVGRYLLVVEFPADIVEFVGSGALTVAHCLAVNALPDDRKHDLLREAAAKGLSAAKLKLTAFPPKVRRGGKGLRYSQRGVTVSVQDGVSFAAFQAAVAEISGQYAEKLKLLSKSDLSMHTVLASVGK